ncbi:Transcriptional regulatory protein ZraR [Phycisphaerae bacterium RAS1]|nr:Transcriptional regulatory protein ZraR [Phycisphaerae bacterium RAS1]
MVRRVLASWIGHADLRAFAASLPEEDRTNLLKVLGQGRADAPGPLKTLLDAERFDEVNLLANYEKRWIRGYCGWLGQKVKLHPVSLKDPTHYGEIFEAADTALRTIVDGRAGNIQLNLHLSPGTPAMAAIWILLGKTRYPATFYQTHQGRAWKTDIPFDITLDFVPELLKAPDAHLQHLAAQSPGQVEGFRTIIGDSTAIRLAVGRAQRAAVRHVPVLVLGESGTGKEVFARAIHAASPRRNGPFVAINCAAIPRELLESELFGYAKGAFTGAARDKPGAFDQADGGTLFLDEIGECDPAMQVKLLRVLEPPTGSGPCARVFRAVGAIVDTARDVRIVAATNRDLLSEVAMGRFREDLYYRLAVVSVRLPPLRDRRQDIPLIASHLLAKINDEFRAHEPGFRDKGISASAMGFVRRQDWPGNVRQLNNVLVQAVTLASGDAIDRAEIAAALADSPRKQTDGLPETIDDNFVLEKHLEEIQRRFLTLAMEQAGGVKTRAAALLGMQNYQTLDAQLKRLKVAWSKDGRG